ncbi:putative transmembrane protein [Gigaspora margarita]|uniref:Putative transmembrane protein n=1 Tax=Gigaspora margarita TaxID=4874 RepID=A0A8H4AWS9_GIGMA|nr:putative transmembrane protein [Gigaspora margarita]
MSFIWIALNALRVLSIFSLVLVISTCIIVNVKGFTSLGQSNIIFQFLNRCVIGIEALILILVEIGWTRIYGWFPVLQSWTFFGFLQVITGSFILGYDSGINSNSFLGYSLYIFIIIPGWFVFIIGMIYILLGVIGGQRLKQQRQIGGRSEKSRPPPYTV